ncbi:hypothetical protein XSR1_70175 [Xenorhabdus szentirmaii DSM 16338]|uniref:Phage tail fibre protein N-terminal domain-containing protein n=2 Tax=Xenorhabdus szentirmaii TaxID=290112 RepID=W1J3V9_9GAMM|nr:phage tail protein [Xenorhabdus szentirmaii DSM 16338]CDL85437.1 hypothetical protein XSR1_70175 [Xenorhabdus szentirmaii DSM 16338]
MTKFFALLTRLGADKLANAAALGTKLNITHMAVGDGGGTLPTPDTAQTKLVNERRRAAINVLSVDPKNTHQIIAEQVIPENEGGWWIREIGLFDQDGVLIAVGNCAETYKPQLQEGSGRTQTLRMVLIVSHTNAVSLKIDPSVVLATREYADTLVKQAISEHEKSRRHPDATLREKGFVVLSNAVDSQSETQAATPKAVKAAYDLAAKANQSADNCLEKVKSGADIPDKKLFADNIGAYPKTGGVIEGKVFARSDIDAMGWIGGDRLYERFDNGKWAKVYSERNPPTAGVVGAYSRDESNNRYALKKSHELFTCGGVDVEATHDWAGVKLKNANGYYVQLSASPHDKPDMLTMYYRDNLNNTQHYVGIPKQSGMVALTDQLLGINQKWIDVTSNRDNGKWYLNNTNQPIVVYVQCQKTDAEKGHFSMGGEVDGHRVGYVWVSTIGIHSFNFIVPVGSKYMVRAGWGSGVSSGAIVSWIELRSS